MLKISENIYKKLILNKKIIFLKYQNKESIKPKDTSYLDPPII